MTRSCTECQYTKTCVYVDWVQSGNRACPLETGTIVKRLVSTTIPGQVREARRRIAGMQRIGIPVIAPPGMLVRYDL